MERSLLLVAFALLCGCHQAPTPPASSWDQLQQAISKHPVIRDEQDVRALIPYESITLERGPCFGDCPVYAVTFRRDGTALLVTDHLLPEESVRYSSQIRLKDFARLAQLVHAAQSASKQPEYMAQWTDDYAATITVNTQKGIWSVTDYGQVAPPEIWALETVLHSMRMSQDWQGGAK